MSKRVITLGTWEGEPIEWEVLKEDDMQMLVMSVKSICQIHYNYSNDSKWKSSFIRAYLNNDFWNKAFNDKEKKQIINAKLADVGTKDNVFLISKDEYSLKNRAGWAYTRTSYDSYSCVWVLNADSWKYVTSQSDCIIYPAMYIKK